MAMFWKMTERIYDVGVGVGVGGCVRVCQHECVGAFTLRAFCWFNRSPSRLSNFFVGADACMDLVRM